MVNAAIIPQAKRLPALIALAAGAALLVGVGLMKLDEHMGTAHLTQADKAGPSRAVVSPPDAPLPGDTPESEPVAGASFAPAFEVTNQPQKPEAAPAQAQAAPAEGAFVIRHTMPITDPIKYGQWFWNEDGAPTGPIVITVDLDARVLSVFRGGYEIGTTAVLLGTQEKPTPLGVFPITQKDAHHMSNLYDAPMPYMMRLTNDGVSIHATNVQNGYASHGCVGVPLGFAQKVFGVAKLGDKVYITRGKQAKIGDRIGGA